VPDLANNLNIFAGTANGTLITLQVSSLIPITLQVPSLNQSIWARRIGAPGQRQS